MNYKKFVNNLKRQAEENPLAAIAAAGLVVTAMTKLLQANTARNNSKTWQQEVMRRSMK
jgi:hypothetical protein